MAGQNKERNYAMNKILIMKPKQNVKGDTDLEDFDFDDYDEDEGDGLSDEEQEDEEA